MLFRKYLVAALLVVAAATTAAAAPKCSTKACARSTNKVRNAVRSVLKTCDATTCPGLTGYINAYNNISCPSCPSLPWVAAPISCGRYNPPSVSNFIARTNSLKAEACLAYCGAYGANHMALYEETDCFCYTSEPEIKKAALQSECDNKCRGDATLTLPCGNNDDGYGALYHINAA